MTRVAVISLKGGTGKTTVCLGLAGAAAARGSHVLVVDLDPQANASAALGVTAPRLTISDALADGRRGIASDATVDSGWPVREGSGLVRVVPSERSLEHRATTEPGSHSRLHRVIDGVAGDTDLVLIDCPPTLGELTRNALVAADVALIVTDPSYFALSGAQQAVDAVEVVRSTANPHLGLAGIVINRVRSRSAEQTFRLDELRSTYPDLLLGPTLSERVAVPASQGAGLPIQSWAGAGARAFGHDLSALLDSVASRIATLNQPRAAFTGSTP